MNRTRLFFALLLASAAVGIAVAAFVQYGGVWFGARAPQTVAQSQQSGAAPSPNMTLFVQPTEMPAPSEEAKAATATPATDATANGNTGERLKPIWGPNYKENDGLGTLVCGAYAFSGDYPLQQIQMAGLDVKRGFHLGIVPFYLNENYVVTAKERVGAMRDGKIDCLLTTFDLFALEDPGFITGFINESAGADQMWARDVSTLNDLKGKRIAFEANGPSEFFVLDLLNTVKLSPKDVVLAPQPDQNSAIKTFNDGGADVVAGWSPVIFAAEQGGGKLLASSKDFRSILGAIVMSPQAMESKDTVIQLFHEAWFEAVARQETDFDAAAQQVADWGYNDFLGVSKDKAAEDLRNLLGGVAQANLTDNARAFAKMSSVIDRLLKTRKLWAAAGHDMPNSDVTKLVEPRFVQAAAAGLQLDFNAPNGFVNNTFSLGRDQLAIVSANSADASTTISATGSTSATRAVSTTISPQDVLSNVVTVATLPCSRFEFVPNSTVLAAESQQALQDCAVDVLKQNITLYVSVKGSSAWPGPKGAIPRVNVESTAQERAQSVADFLIAQGISKERFLVEWTMPPPDHWETTDLAKQAQDRFVEIKLLSAGL